MLTEEQTSTPPIAPPQASNDRWSAMSCLLHATFRPATTARRTQHVSLWAAWRVHLLAAVIAVLEIVVLVCLVDRPGRSLLESLIQLGAELTREFERSSEVVLAVFGLTTVGIELGFVAIALIVAPWGARVEKLGVSIAHALRRVWLQTPHIVWGIALIGLFTVPLFHASYHWRRSQSFQFAFPTIPQPGPNATTAEQEEYHQSLQQAQIEWQARYQVYQMSRPFFVRYGEVIVGTLSFAAGLWFVWALLRAVGAPRDSVQIFSPPLCEFCGYNLSMMPAEALCPECGQAVKDSLGPDVRRGTAWQQRAVFGCLGAYARSCGQAMFAPATFGRQIRIYTPGTDHRLLLLIHFVAMAIVSSAGFLLIVYVADGARVFDRDPEIWLAGLAVGTVTATTMLLGMLFWAGVVGLDRYARDQRNLFPASAQAVSYLSLGLLVGVAFAWASGAAAVSEPRFLQSWARDLQIDDELLAFLTWLCVNLVWVVLWCVSVWRVTAAARFANR